MVLQDQEVAPTTPQFSPACLFSNFLPWDFMTHTLPPTVWAPMKWPLLSYVWCGSYPTSEQYDLYRQPYSGAPSFSHPGSTTQTPLFIFPCYCVLIKHLENTHLYKAGEVTVDMEQRTQAIS